MPFEIIMLFLFGAVILTIGMGFFSLGSEMAMIPMGEETGIRLVKSGKISLICLVSIVMGTAVTIAEPDLQVLADQVPSIPKMVLILTIAIGVGVFLMIAILRTLHRLPLAQVLIVLYSITFILLMFLPDEFIPVAFDSGGVTTGAMTVPFIMALGIGISSITNDNRSLEDSFGMVALCSIGPILSVIILGICYKPAEINYSSQEIITLYDTKELADRFIEAFPDYIKEVAVALLPIVAIFMVFMLCTGGIKKKQFLKICVGTVYTFIGLVLFLTGANVGFMYVGTYIGKEIAGNHSSWVLVIVAMIVGYFIIIAEPAVNILAKQVADITGGSISEGAIKKSLSIGVAVSLGLSMIRIVTGLHIIWLLVPCYITALTLTFFVQPVFTGIAFDSGGVASGTMTATFVLPFALGACESAGGNIMTDAFGTVALVAVTPLIMIQLLGLVHNRKAKRLSIMESDNEIVDYFNDISVIDEYRQREEVR